MSPHLSPKEIREAIADSLAENVKAYELDSACEALGLDTSKAGDNPYGSKRVFVRSLLFGKSRAELLELGQMVVDEYGDHGLESLLGGAGGITGVNGELKNLIFAANGPKPRIVLRDAVNNVIEIVENEEYCLVYDRTLEPGGLSWGALVDWWCEHHDPSPADREGAARRLYERLRESLQSEPERLLLQTYGAQYRGEPGLARPALIPQIYLHYDPYTQAELGTEGSPLTRQRMDFLLILGDRARVVVEVDGRQHYSSGPEPGRASPARYAEMVREDRALRLRGYEVYRFGGAELTGRAGEERLNEFFEALFRRHGVT